MSIFDNTNTYLERMAYAEELIEKHGLIFAERIKQTLDATIKELESLPIDDPRLMENDLEKMKDSKDALSIATGRQRMKNVVVPGVEAIKRVESIRRERAEGGANSHGLNVEERKIRNNQMQDEINRLCAKGQSYSSAQKIVGRKFKLHPDTVRKTTKNPLK